MQTELTTSSLASLFTEIEQSVHSSSDRQGVMRRRLPSSSSCELFVGVSKPSNTRLLIVRFHVDHLPQKFDLPDFRSLEVQIQNETEGSSELLTVTFKPSQLVWNDIFTSLAEDISHSVGTQTDENLAALAFQSRLYQWQRLLQKTGVAGLTDEQQQGLYGELWCLRELILPAISQCHALKSWTGQEATDRDFQFDDSIALEVKTTRSTGSPVMKIASERQLDDLGLKALYLLHLSLEKMNGAGETLPQIVTTLRQLFASDPLTTVLFEDKLLNAGYLETHSARYEVAGYTLHDTNIYLVRDGFPRITPRNLALGVGNVEYAVTVAACQSFTTSILTLSEQIGATR